MPQRNELVAGTKAVAAATGFSVLTSSNIKTRKLNPIQYRRVQLDGSMNEFKQFCQDNMPSNPGDVGLFPYSTNEGKQPDEYYYLKVSDSPLLEKFLHNIPNVGAMEPFDGRGPVLTHLKYYCVVFGSKVGNKDNRMMFFRKHSKAQELTTKGLLARLDLEDTPTFTKIDGRVFKFDRDIDFFFLGEYVFIRNIRSFENITGFTESLQSQSKPLLDALENLDVIDNFVEFRDAVENEGSLMRQAIGILQKGDDLSEIDVDFFKEQSQEYGKELDFVERDGVERVQFSNDPQKRRTILNIIDENYYTGVRTGQKYESLTRRRV